MVGDSTPGDRFTTLHDEGWSTSGVRTLQKHV